MIGTDFSGHRWTQGDRDDEVLAGMVLMREMTDGGEIHKKDGNGCGEHIFQEQGEVDGDI